MGGDAQDVYGPGLDLHHEQDVHAPEQHGAGVQEVTRQEAGRLGGQELPPGRRRPARRGPGSGQDPADRALADPVSQAGQLARDAPVAQRGFCRASFFTSSRTSSGMVGRPAVLG